MIIIGQMLNCDLAESLLGIRDQMSVITFLYLGLDEVGQFLENKHWEGGVAGESC